MMSAIAHARFQDVRMVNAAWCSHLSLLQRPGAETQSPKHATQSGTQQPAAYQSLAEVEGREHPHLRLALGALIVAQLELLRRLCLLHHDHAQPGTRKPLRILMVVGLWEAAVRLSPLRVAIHAPWKAEDPNMVTWTFRAW